MKKSIKKITSLITLALVTSTLVGGQAVSANANAMKVNEDVKVEKAATAAESEGKYATNPSGAVGKQGAITIDGSISDWSDDMLIAQGAAWDIANNWKGGHENCVLDDYALYASWDDNNLYIGWQMVNTTDTWAREGDGPLSDGGRVLDVPLMIALDTGKKPAMTGKMANGKLIWDALDVQFETRVDNIFLMSGKVGLGTPALFQASDEAGGASYDKQYCLNFKTNGIEYKMAQACLPKTIIGLKASTAPSDVYSNTADWVDMMTLGHKTTYDSFYEMKIPFEVLGIDKSYLETNGVGVMQIATRGVSAIDCLPHDPAMLDNALGSCAIDASTSHEKDDTDIITVPLASVGKLRDASVVPKTPTTTPTTKNPAISKFAADKETIKKDEEVKFTCTATDATSYEFKINDKAVDAEEVSKNVLTHTFTEDGDYVVEVTAKGGTGTTAATKKVEFKIGAQEPKDPENPEELKITSFEATNTDEEIETGTKVDFSAEATGADDIKYSFTAAKDGQDAEKLTLNKDGKSTTWTPEEEGTYVIEMTASAEGFDAVTQKKEYKVKAKGTDVPADNSIENIELNTKSNLTVNADNVVRFTTKVEGGQGTLQYLFTVDGIDQGKYSSKAIFDFKSDVVGKHKITVKVKDETGESLESAPKVVQVLENQQTEDPKNENPTGTPKDENPTGTPKDENPTEKPTADASSMLSVAMVMMIAGASLVGMKKRKEN